MTPIPTTAMPIALYIRENVSPPGEAELGEFFDAMAVAPFSKEDLAIFDKWWDEVGTKAAMNAIWGEK